jgi:hypothetical protein
MIKKLKKRKRSNKRTEEPHIDREREREREIERKIEGTGVACNKWYKNRSLGRSVSCEEAVRAVGGWNARTRFL